jgi:hypothetical protein
MGDDIQAIKAGILEIGNIFVVNKADREGSRQTVRQLLNLIELGAGRRNGGDWQSKSTGHTYWPLTPKSGGKLWRSEPEFNSWSSSKIRRSELCWNGSKIAGAPSMRWSKR